MATLVAARLAATAHGPAGLSEAARCERAAAARHWLGALTLPAAVRGAMTQVVDATAKGEADLLAVTLANVIGVTAPHLDRKARSELEQLIRVIGM